MATTAHRSSRPRISQDFIGANNRRRLILGLANAVSESNYSATSVADVVRSTGCARNTFYDNFPSKDGVGTSLLEAVVPEVAELFTRPPADSSVGVMAIEIASSSHSGYGLRAASEIRWARRALEILAKLEPRVVEPDEAPLLGQLPPGRHGLDKDFVASNQRRRLLDGYAISVLQHGFFGATIAHVTDSAAVSRRTFYDHFNGTEDLARAVLADGTDSLSLVEETSSGIGALSVEIVAAARMASSSLDSRRGFAERVIETLATSLGLDR